MGLRRCGKQGGRRVEHPTLSHTDRHQGQHPSPHILHCHVSPHDLVHDIQRLRRTVSRCRRQGASWRLHQLHHPLAVGHLPCRPPTHVVPIPRHAARLRADIPQHLPPAGPSARMASYGQRDRLYDRQSWSHRTCRPHTERICQGRREGSVRGSQDDTEHRHTQP